MQGWLWHAIDMFNMFDLSRPVSDSQFNEIHQAFLQYQVLFFREQKEIPPEQQVIFGKRFGPLHAHPLPSSRRWRVSHWRGAAVICMGERRHREALAAARRS